jgi:uncharacterized membrane protein SpoIIM required for sporulation
MPIFKQMDLDAYSAANSDEWNRLAQLTKKGRFSGPEADELIDHYQAAATQLSAIKTAVGTSIPGDRLSLSISRARLRFTGASVNVLSQVPSFFVWQLPAALYRIRWLCIGVAVGTFVVAFLYGWWATSDPRVIANLATPAELKQYASKDFVDYYSNHSEALFSGLVWTNNAWLAAQCIAFGIIGVYSPYLLLSNAQGIGLSAGIMNHFGHLDIFFLYIAPHGQLELYSIFVAGAAGMAIFWSWVSPGSKTRAQALAAGGRSLFTIVIGLICSLAVSGLIEGFITRQPWPWPLKIGIGTFALAAFLFYQWILGRRANRAGETGDLDEFEAGARTITAG